MARGALTVGLSQRRVEQIVINKDMGLNSLSTINIKNNGVKKAVSTGDSKSSSVYSRLNMINGWVYVLLLLVLLGLKC